jgi:hypothetical protein
MKCPIGDQQAEISRLKTKSDYIATRINSNALTRSEAKLAYEVFYIPALRYSLNITAINQIDMETIQSKATLAFLTAQGYNRHMPREVVYAPLLYQGIGMRHLYDLQGSDSTRLLLQELNFENSMTQKMLLELLDVIQLEAGIGNPILEDCRSLEYIEWGWIPQIRDFLHHINGKIMHATRKPDVYREHDQYLMDASYLINQSRRDKLYIHRCRLYLQVETLSDIATAAGTQIHRSWFQREASRPSKSMIQWPRQNCPNKQAWNAWVRFLRSFESNAGKLRKPLGKWIQQNKRRIHQAIIDNSGDLWLFQQDMKFNQHKQALQRRKHIVYHRNVNRALLDPPTHYTPTDILSVNEVEIRVAKPASTWESLGTEPITAKWFEEAPRQYQQLVGFTEILFDDENHESEIPAENTLFEIASDGGHEPRSGISTFGWVVSMDRKILARGRGPVEVHPELAESFRAEGYGLASAGIFIKNFINKFNVDANRHSWKIYIDNTSLIKRLASYDDQLRVSRWNLRSDEDITSVVQRVWNAIPHDIIHVKSHQDEHTDWEELSFQATLNIIADEQATRQRHSMAEAETDVRNLSRVQLRIGDIAITRDSQHWILKSAGRIPIKQYYQERFGWTSQVFDSIGWEIQLKALRSFPSADQTRIIKFTHGWLPTQKRLHMEGLAKSPRCPICYHLLEDNIHLLKCKHPRMQETQRKISHHLEKHLHEHGNSEFTNILEIGLLSSLEAEWTADLSYVSKEWRQAIMDQNSIGWIQIYRGRLAKSMIKAMDEHYSTMGVNRMTHTGERWAKQLITNLWKIVLELWSIRNDMIHHERSIIKDSYMMERLTTRIQRCYEDKGLLKAKERQQWFSADIKDLLERDHKFLTAWIAIVERLIRIARREQKSRPPSSMIMERFLNLTAGRQHKQRQPSSRSRRFSQDMNPD